MLSPRLAALSFFALLASSPAAAATPATQDDRAAVALFHRTIANRPFWLVGGADQALLDLITAASRRGITTPGVDLIQLRASIERAGRGSPADRQHAELLLSEAYLHLVQALGSPRDRNIVYSEADARPQPRTPLTVLTEAAGAPSLAEFVRSAGWMHPVFRELRQARLAAERDGRIEEVSKLQMNLEQARILPTGNQPHILVNIPAARLDFYEGGKVVRSMKVVVGTRETETPQMAGLLRYAILNPYWHVPPELTRRVLAKRVLSEGLGYLRSKGYEVVTEFAPAPTVLNPAKIDWRAVAAGRKEVFIRQRPGPQNGMGQIKFMFPNSLGIYLHDTPGKALFERDDRSASNGCVRLEDAPGLARLILGNAPSAASLPEQVVALQRPIPVHLAYLTLEPNGGAVVARPDIYDRDTATRPKLTAPSNMTRS